MARMDQNYLPRPDLWVRSPPGRSGLGTVQLTPLGVSTLESAIAAGLKPNALWRDWGFFSHMPMHLLFKAYGGTRSTPRYEAFYSRDAALDGKILHAYASGLSVSEVCRLLDVPYRLALRTLVDSGSIRLSKDRVRLTMSRGRFGASTLAPKRFLQLASTVGVRPIVDIDRTTLFRAREVFLYGLGIRSIGSVNAVDHVFCRDGGKFFANGDVRYSGVPALVLHAGHNLQLVTQAYNLHKQHHDPKHENYCVAKLATAVENRFKWYLSSMYLFYGLSLKHVYGGCSMDTVYTAARRAFDKTVSEDIEHAR